MLFPNKLLTYNESVISKFPFILDELIVSPISVSDLYKQVADRLSGVSEYLDALDCLYALGKIEFNEERGVLCYVS